MRNNYDEKVVEPILKIRKMGLVDDIVKLPQISKPRKKIVEHILDLVSNQKAMMQIFSVQSAISDHNIWVLERLFGNTLPNFKIFT